MPPPPPPPRGGGWCNIHSTWLSQKRKASVERKVTDFFKCSFFAFELVAVAVSTVTFLKRFVAVKKVSALVFVSVKRVRYVFSESPLLKYRHPDNTGTSACPLVRISRVRLYHPLLVCLCCCAVHL